MNVTWLGHAALFVNAANRTLLIDPWFAEPVFGGAWFRYPPPPYPDASTMPRPEFLVLSHAHPDHAGDDTLRQLRPDTPTLAMPFRSGVLHRRLARLGFSDVRWQAPWETRELAPGLKLTFVPHDRGWEVASIVLEAEGLRLYHGNDNPLSLEGYREVVRRLGPIDLAFLPYAGASSYPTKFDGTPEQLRERCQKKKQEGLARFTDGLRGLQPKEAVPFASSWALLEERELELNYVDRPTPTEALTHAMKLALEQGTHLLHLEPGDEWTPETGALNKGLTAGWDSDVASVRRYALQEKDRVERAIARARRRETGIEPAALDAQMQAHLAAVFRDAPPADAPFRMGFEAKGLAQWSVVFTRDGARVDAKLSGDEDEVLRLEPGELWAILSGAATWEDPWYGYRLEVRKREGAGYHRAFWEMLLSFDTTMR